MATTKTCEIQKLAHNILIDSFGTIYDTSADAENITRLLSLALCVKLKSQSMLRTM